MKNTTNLLILNLAVADLLFILVRESSRKERRERLTMFLPGQICVPATASDYILMFWPFGLAWCRTVQYIIYVTAYVSIYTLVLMAADRLVNVPELKNIWEIFPRTGSWRSCSPLPP